MSSTCDGGATLALALGVLSITSLFLAVQVHEWAPTPIGAALLLLGRFTGFYAVLFAIGALSNRTPRRPRAWLGMLVGAFPPTLAAWFVAHGGEL